MSGVTVQGLGLGTGKPDGLDMGLRGMKHHPDGTRINERRVLKTAPPSDIAQALEALVRPKCVPFLRAWMDYAKPANVSKFRYVLHAIHTMQRAAGTNTKAVAERFSTTYMEDVSRELTARYLGPSVGAEKQTEMYAGSIFKQDRHADVTKWLTKARDSDRDKFRDAFASITNYYRERKGPRSLYGGDFKFRDQDFKDRLRSTSLSAQQRKKLAEGQELSAQEKSTIARQLGISVEELEGVQASMAGGSASRASRRGADGNASDSGDEAETTRRLTSRGVPSSAYLQKRPASRGGNPFAATGASTSRPSTAAAAAEPANKAQIDRVMSHYGFLIQDKAVESVTQWLGVARADNAKKLEYVLHNVKKVLNKKPINGGRSASRPGSRSASRSGPEQAEAAKRIIAPDPYMTTARLSNLEATGYAEVKNASAAVPVENMIHMYAGSIIRAEHWDLLGVWLESVDEREKDKFRDAFSSLTSWHKARRGTRTTYNATLKVPSLKRRQNLATARERVDEALGRETTHRVTERTIGRGNRAAAKEAAATPEPRYEKRGPDGKVIKSGGFFGKSSYSSDMVWKRRAPSPTASRIKEKNSKSHNTLGGMNNGGNSMRSTAQLDFQGTRGARSTPFKPLH